VIIEQKYFDEFRVGRAGGREKNAFAQEEREEIHAEGRATTPHG
jgi:hypothetical protein